MSELPKALQSSLGDSETVEWSSSPGRKANLASYGVDAGAFCLILLLSVLPFIAFVVNPVVAAVATFVLCLAVIARFAIEYKLTETVYAATNDRVIKFTDGFNTEIEYIAWEDVGSIYVETDFTSSVLDAGQVSVVGRKVDNLYLVPVQAPYDALTELDDLR